jgi:hypothetical protein
LRISYENRDQAAGGTGSTVTLSPMASSR